MARILEYGGGTHSGRRKVARPLDPTLPLYLLFRSSRARGPWAFNQPVNQALIQKILSPLAKKLKIKLIGKAISSDQIHLLIQPKSKDSFRKFMRLFPGTVSRLITGAKKGHPVGRFWDFLAYSRVIQKGEELRLAKSLLRKADFKALEKHLRSETPSAELD